MLFPGKYITGVYTTRTEVSLSLSDHASRNRQWSKIRVAVAGASPTWTLYTLRAWTQYIDDTCLLFFLIRHDSPSWMCVFFFKSPFFLARTATRPGDKASIRGGGHLIMMFSELFVNLESFRERRGTSTDETDRRIFYRFEYFSFTRHVSRTIFISYIAFLLDFYECAKLYHYSDNTR